MSVTERERFRAALKGSPYIECEGAFNDGMLAEYVTIYTNDSRHYHTFDREGRLCMAGRALWPHVPPT